MNRGTKRRSRLLVLTGGALVIALGSLAACVTNLSYRYDPNAEGGSAESGSRDGGAGSCRRVLLVGGNGQEAGPPIKQAFYGAISGDDIHWTVAPPLPFASAAGGGLLVGDRVVVAGGSNDRDKYSSFVGEAWRPAQLLPGRAAGCVMGSLQQGELHLLCTDDGNPDGGLQSAFFGKDDGNEVGWVAIKPAEKFAPGSMVAPIGDRWLVVAPDGSAQLGTVRNGDGRALDWTETTKRPTLATNGCAVGIGNRAYFISGDATQEVSFATLNGGTVNWSGSAQQPLPEARAGAACIYARGRVWVMGGAPSGSQYTKSVYSTVVTANGLDQPWTLANESLQNAVYAPSLACLP